MKAMKVGKGSGGKKPMGKNPKVTAKVPRPGSVRTKGLQQGGKIPKLGKVK